MSIGLLFPAALAALAALSLPLLIHLTRRSDRQIIDFAALRWLRAKERARRRLRIDEWLLLALRMLLLAAVVLLLAQPIWFAATDHRAWVVVVPTADATALSNEPALRAASWHWLAPGFPPFDSAPPMQPVETASLLRELDASLPATQALTVIVPEQLAGLDGERIRLSRALDWRIVASRALPASAATPAAITRRVAIRYDPSNSGISRYFAAAVTAWNSGNAATAADPSQPAFVIDAASSAVALPAATDWLLWLASDPLPAPIERWLGDGGSVLRAASSAVVADDAALEIWRSAHTGTWLSAQRHGCGRLLIVHGALAVEQLPELLDPEFPTLLRSWFAPPARAADRAMAKDVAPTQGMATWPTQGKPLRAAMIWLIAALWLLERWLASARRKAART